MRTLACAAVLGSTSALRRSSRSGAKASRYVADVPVFELASEKAPSDKWLVFMKDGGHDSALETLCGQAECTSMGHASGGGIPFVSMRASEVSLAEVLRGNEDVDFVTPDYVLEPDLDPSPEDAAKAEAEAASGPTLASVDWGLSRIGVPQATHTGKGVNVYVFDSGVKTIHEEFEKRAIPTLDWGRSEGRVSACIASNRSCADDTMGHGTHVAGIVAGSQYGVAPDATVRAMKMDFRTADGGMSVAYANLDWLVRNHQKPAILQMSFGWPKQLPGSEIAIQKVLAAGITVVAASGNSRKDACGFTWGHITDIITVDASDSRDHSASFTNYGPCTTLYAPGVTITAANYRGGLTAKSGTSMAAPMVSGAAALLLEENPNMSPAEVKAALIANAERDVLINVPKNTPNLLLKVA